MQLDFTTLGQSTSYKLLTALVAPRPIALITTVDAQGRVNAAPFSFFNVMGTVPPIVVFAPSLKEDGTPKDTMKNIEATKECVVHIVEEAQGQAMTDCAWPHPHGVNEIERVGFTQVPSVSVKPPRIAEAPVALECRVIEILKIGDNTVVAAQILTGHVKDGILDPEKLRLIGSFAPIGRMEGPDAYSRTSDKFRMKPTAGK